MIIAIVILAIVQALVIGYLLLQRKANVSTTKVVKAGAIEIDDFQITVTNGELNIKPKK